VNRLIYILPLLFFGFLVKGRTIRVGIHESTKTISVAVSSARAGDTVLVEKGIYHERNLVIGKAIILLGKDYPVLDGEHRYEIISVRSNGVVIEGFKLIHSGVSSLQDIAGIKIYNSRDVIIRNNILDDTFFGIYAQSVIRCTIIDNKLTAHATQEQQSGNGIHCWKSDSMQIIGNKVSGHRDGIYFEFVTNSMIRQNLSAGNIRYGLHFMFSQDDTYIGNTFRDNGAGVSVMFSHGVKMIKNHFEKNWGDGSYGILLKEIRDSQIEGNQFKQNTIAIYAEGASRIKMERNVFEGNGWALRIQASCMEVSLINNNFIGNTFDVATNGSLVLNTFNNNYWDKYEGYDLDKDKFGDVPYRPVSMFSMIAEQNPTVMMLFRSFMAGLLDKSERLLPSLTPENLKDDHPLMQALPL